jgi:hypothetical protein
MKAFLWLLASALAIECLAGGLLARFVMRSIADTHRVSPMFTDWFFGHPAWWLLVPVPWFVSAVILSRRPAIATDSVLLFAGTLIVAAAFLAGVLVIAAILPLLTFKV